MTDEILYPKLIDKTGSQEIKYKHTYALNFEIFSSEGKGKNITGSDLRAKLMSRIFSMKDVELLAVVGPPLYTDEH